MDNRGDPGPHLHDSRRLFGPSLWLDRAGVVLEGTCDPAAAETVAIAWRKAVQRLAAALRWTDVTCTVRQRGGELMLAFTAPGDRLLTATEVNEWAWRRATRDAGLDAGAPAHSPGDLPRDEKAALEQLRVLSSIEAQEPSSDLAIAAPQGVAVALVTGSNGKTTTTRLIAAMTSAHGWRTGWNCTDGVFIAGVPVERGDWSGPAGAQRVVREPLIQAAVLESARGGILRRGLGVLDAAVAVVTNVEADHFGEYGIFSLADLAEVKLVVAKGLSTNGVLVLNADDATLRNTSLPAVRTLWFSASGGTDAALAADVRAWREDGHLWLGDRARRHDLGEVRTMPITVRGAAAYNVENALAAALAAALLGVPPATIAQVLGSFGALPTDNPGRLERYTIGGAQVLVDYAHNPAGLAGLLGVARGLAPARLLLLLGQAGNRADDALADLARTAWSARPDRVIIKELDSYRRGREVGEVTLVLAAALRSLGVAESQLDIVADEVEAVETALRWARPGDVLVLPVHALDARERVSALLEARTNA